jgi:hypothetical protein
MFRVVNPPTVTVITGQTVSTTFRCPAEGSIDWPVPDAVITVIYSLDDGWSYHSKHVERAVYRNIIIVYSRILLDNYWHWFTIHGPMNINLFSIWKLQNMSQLTFQNASYNKIDDYVYFALCYKITCTVLFTPKYRSTHQLSVEIFISCFSVQR